MFHCMYPTTENVYLSHDSLLRYHLMSNYVEKLQIPKRLSGIVSASILENLVGIKKDLFDHLGDTLNGEDNHPDIVLVGIYSISSYGISQVFNYQFVCH